MKKKIAIIVAALLLIVLFGWRLWPHSFSTIISVNKNAITNIACQASVCGAENGNAFINSYTLNALSPQDAGFEEIIAMLDSSNYHQDFRNLLPWPVDSVDSGNTHNGLSASVNVNLVYAQHYNRKYQLFLAASCIGLGVAWDVLSCFFGSNRALPVILSSTPFVLFDFWCFKHRGYNENK